MTSVNWLDTANVVWLDTASVEWKDISLLIVALQSGEEFDDLTFDNVASVTPSDSTLLKAGYLYVGSVGRVKALLAQNNQEIIFNVLTAGSWIKVRVKKVFLTGTDATDIVHCF